MSAIELDVDGLNSTDLRQLTDALLSAAQATWIDPPCALALARLAHHVSSHNLLMTTESDRHEVTHSDGERVTLDAEINSRPSRGTSRSQWTSRGVTEDRRGRGQDGSDLHI
jgi:hypothetical protein